MAKTVKELISERNGQTNLKTVRSLKNINNEPQKSVSLSERLDNWFKEAETYYSDYSKKYSNRSSDNYIAGTAADMLSAEKTYNNQVKEAEYLRNALSKHSDVLGTEYLKNLSDTMDKLLKDESLIYNDYKSINDFYSQFENEESFNSWKDYNQKYNELLRYKDNSDFNEFRTLGADKVNNKTFLGGTENEVMRYKNDPLARARSQTREALFAEYATDEELNTYNYILGKEGTDNANKYLDRVMEYVNSRTANKAFTALEKAPALKYIVAPGLGMANFGEGLTNLFSGADYIPNSANKQLQGLISNSLLKEDGTRSVGSIAYDLLVNAGNMVPSILIGAGTGVSAIGTAFMGASAAGNAYQEGLQLGLDKTGSRVYSTLVGASEALLERALGGIAGLGGENSISAQLINKVDVIKNTFARVAAKIGVQALSEFTEESLQELLEPVFRFAGGADLEAPDFEEALYAGMLGALSAGMLDVIPTISNDVRRAKAIGKYVDMINATESVFDIANSFNADSEIYKTAEKYSKTGKYSDYQIGRLVEKMFNDVSAENVSMIKQELIKEGIDEKLSEKIAIQFENDLENKEVKDTFDFEKLDPAVQDAILGVHISEIQDQNSIENRRIRALDAIMQQRIKARDTVSIEKNKYSVGEAEEIINEKVNDDVTEEQILKRLLAGNTEVQAKETAPAQNTAVSVPEQNVAENARTVRDIINERKGTAEGSVVGLEAQKAETGNSANTSINADSSRKRGTVKGINVSLADLRSEFNDMQNTAYSVLSGIAELTGQNIYLVKSDIDENGNYINDWQGKFNESTGDIVIDITAGHKNIKTVNELARYCMLRTFTHEETHFAKAFGSEEEWNTLKKIVFDVLEEKGISVDELREELQLDDRNLSNDRAEEEIVAEAMADVLPDSRFAERLYEESPSFFEKLLGKLKEFLQKIKSYFSRLAENRSRVSNAMKEEVNGTIRYIEKVVNAWDNLVMSAVKNYQNTIDSDNRQTQQSSNITQTAETEAETNIPAPIAETETTETATTEKTKNVTPAEETVPEVKPAEETVQATTEEKIPPKSETEEAKAKIKKAIYVESETTNAEALLTGIKQKSLSLDTVVFKNVKGFNSTQQESLAKALIDGVYTDKEVIKTEVPFDGTFAIKNNAEYVAKVLDRLGVKAVQEAVFSKKINAFLKDTGKGAIISKNGQNYISDSAVIIRTDSSVDAMMRAGLELKYSMSVLDLSRAYMKHMFESEYTKLTTAPVMSEVSGKNAYIFDVDGTKVAYQKKYVDYFDGNDFYISEPMETVRFLQTKNKEGKTIGFVLNLRLDQNDSFDDATPSNLKSFKPKKETKGKTQNTEEKVETEKKSISEIEKDIEKQTVNNLDIKENEVVVDRISKTEITTTVNTETAVEQAKEIKETAKAEARKRTKKLTEDKKEAENDSKIEDFGKKIGGAKKDVWMSRGLYTADLSNMNADEKTKYVEKKNVWKPLNYQDMIKNGTPVEIAYMTKVIRDALPARPIVIKRENFDADCEHYVDFVRIVQKATEKCATRDDFSKLFKEIFIDEGFYEANGNWDASYGTTALKRTAKGEEYRHYVSSYESDLYPILRNLETYQAPEWNRALSEIKRKQFGVDTEAKLPKGISIDFTGDGKYTSLPANTYYVTKGYFIIAKGFATEADARQWIKEKFAKPSSTGKTKFVPDQLQSIHRKGLNLRENNTKHISGQDYIDTFGFYGGEFGNWLNQKDRETNLDYGYDAFYDLGMALGITNKDISLGGNLSIAFGARGEAGAVAHYEPIRSVINLTKMKGAGSLAHEWGHALDNFMNDISTSGLLSEQRNAGKYEAFKKLLKDMVEKPADSNKLDELNKKAAEANEKSRKLLANSIKADIEGRVNGAAKYHIKDEAKSSELKEKVNAIINKIIDRKAEVPDFYWKDSESGAISDISNLIKSYGGNVIPKEARIELQRLVYRYNSLFDAKPAETRSVKTDFLAGSEAFDSNHSKSDNGYWSSKPEMFARAFSCYIKDKLAEKGYYNDYLAGHADIYLDVIEENGERKLIYADPVGEERKRLNADFDELFKELIEKGMFEKRESEAVQDEFLYEKRGRAEETDLNADYEAPITAKDVSVLRSIGRKSINEFTSEDIQKSAKWAYKFYKELGTKSPFFRAWFGDYRSYENDTVKISEIPEYEGTNEARKANRGIVTNADTGWDIRISREGETNTISHSGANRLSEYGLSGIRSLIENGILLDSEVHEHHSNNSKTEKTDRIAFDHKIYALGQNDEGIGLYRITIEESFANPANPNDKRFHNLKYIEKVADIGSLTRYNNGAESTNDVTTTNYSISDLFNLVKTYDKDFNAGKPVNSALLNENGTPKMFYHGTNAEFEAFDKNKIGTFESGNVYFVDGHFKSVNDEHFFFTSDKFLAKEHAEGAEALNGGKAKVLECYVSVKKPLVITEDEYYAKQKRYSSQDWYDKNRPGILSEYKSGNYDGIIIKNPARENDIMVAIPEPAQIKSVDNIGTFDGGNDKYRYEKRSEPLTNREILEVAADIINEHELTAPQKDALRIIKKKLETLKDLEDQRQEQGRLYKEYTFVKDNTDKLKANEAKNRMNILDKQIQRANEEILSVEDKSVLSDVLKKARKVIETEERTRRKEMYARKRARMQEAERINKYKGRITDTVNELKQWLNKPDVKKNKLVPEPLREAVAQFLSTIDFTSKQNLRGGERTKADKAFIAGLEKLQKVIENKQKEDGEAFALDLPAEFLEEFDKMKENFIKLAKDDEQTYVLNKMTSDELKNLYEKITNVKQFIQKSTYELQSKTLKTVHAAGDSTINYLNNEIKTLARKDTKIGRFADWLNWDLERAAYGFERFGEGGKAIYNELRKGEGKLSFLAKEAEDFAHKIFSEKDVITLRKKELTLDLSKGSVTMPISRWAGVYATSKIEQEDGTKIGLNHLFNGGFAQNPNEDPQAINEDDLKIIEEAIAGRPKEIADDLLEYMTKTGGKWYNEATIKLYGTERARNKVYYPLSSDGRYFQIKDSKTGPGLYDLFNMSFTKDTVQGANNPIVIYDMFDVFSNHMASMAQFSSMAIPVRNLIKWLNYEQKEYMPNGSVEKGDSVRRALARAYGRAADQKPGASSSNPAERFIIGIIKAYNGTEAQGSLYDTLPLQMLRRYNSVQVSFKLRVAALQGMAYVRARFVLTADAMNKGFATAIKNYKRNKEEMYKYSGIAVRKSQGFYDTNISYSLTERLTYDKSKIDKLLEIGLKGAEKMDEVTWVTLWGACKYQVEAEKKYVKDSPEYFEAVSDLFEEVVYKTQVVDSPLTRVAFMRDKGLFARSVTSFMGESIASLNLVTNAAYKWRSEGPGKDNANSKNFAKACYVFALSAILTAAVEAAIDALKDDDDYKTGWEKYKEALTKNSIDELLILNDIPIINDLVDIAKTILSKLGVDTYGYDVPSLYGQAFEQIVDSISVIIDKINDDNKYTWWGTIKKALGALSGLSGIPVSSIAGEVTALWNVIVGRSAPSLKIRTYDPGIKNRVKYAYYDGYLTDSEAVEELTNNGITFKEAIKLIKQWDKAKTKPKTKDK